MVTVSEWYNTFYGLLDKFSTFKLFADSHSLYNEG